MAHIYARFTRALSSRLPLRSDIDLPITRLIPFLSLNSNRQSLVLELQTTRNLLVSSLNKVQDLELESRKVPKLEDRIRDLEKTLAATPAQSTLTPATKR